MNKLGLGVFLLLLNLGENSDFLLLRILPILFFVFLIFEETFRNNKLNLFSGSFRLFFLLITIVVVSLMSTQRTDISIESILFQILTFVTFILSFLLVSYRESKRNSLLSVFMKACYIPLLLYLVVNLYLFFINIHMKDVNIGTSVMLSYFGLTMDRVWFILAKGINGYGVVAGALFNISLVGFFMVKKFRKTFFLGLIVSFITLLLTDSRGPVIYSLLIFILLNFFIKNVKKPRFLWLIPLIGFIGPILMLFLLELISDSQFSESLSRSSGDLSSGNSRLGIWIIALSDFIVFKPEFHVFGYGEFGHHTAGLSQLYGVIFGEGNKAFEYMHPHNTFLSIVLDLGYFGLLIYLLLQFSIIRVVKRYWNDNKLSIILLGNLLYFNFIGIGETLFGFYYKDIMYVYFMVNTFAFLLLEKNK
jgi:hypothetical protein